MVLGKTETCGIPSSLYTMSWSSVTSGKWPNWSVSECGRSWRHRPQRPRVRPREPLCELLPGGDSVPLTGEGFRAVFEDFFGSVEDEGRGRIKGWRRNRRSAQSLLPAVRAVDGGFRGVSKWGQNRRGAITSAVVIPESLHPQEKSRGHAPERSSF